MIKKRVGAAEHNHPSAKDRIRALLVEREHLNVALLHPNRATPRTLTTSISGSLRDEDLVPMMSSAKAIQRRLERGKAQLVNYPLLPTTAAEMMESFPATLKVRIE